MRGGEGESFMPSMPTVKFNRAQHGKTCRVFQLCVRSRHTNVKMIAIPSIHAWLVLMRAELTRNPYTPFMRNKAGLMINTSQVATKKPCDAGRNYFL